MNKEQEVIEREKLAELCHKQWSGWLKYMFGKSLKKLDGTILIPEWAVIRWRRQAYTPYNKLSSKEKDSDRSEADRFIALLKPKPGKKYKCPNCGLEGKAAKYPHTCIKPVNSPPTSKEKTDPITEPETGVKKGEVASQPSAQTPSEFTKECRETELDEWSDWRIKEICDCLVKAEARSIDCPNRPASKTEVEMAKRLCNYQDEVHSLKQRIKELEALVAEYVKMKE